MLLWLWCGTAATALIHPLAWEPPYAAGIALKKKKKRQMSKSDPGGTGLHTFLCYWNFFHCFHGNFLDIKIVKMS